MAMELGWAGEDWVGEGGPAIGTGISGAVVASYHTCVPSPDSVTDKQQPGNLRYTLRHVVA